MEDILNQGLLLLGNAALAALTVGLARLTNWIAKKVKSEHWSAVIMKLDDVVMKVVRHVYTSYVKPLKIANADGKLTESEKAHARAKARAAIKSYLGIKGLKELGSLLSAGRIDEYLTSSIEDAIETSKNAGKLARGAPDPK